MKATNRLLNLGLTLFFSIASGCAIPGERRLDRQSLPEAPTLSSDADDGLKTSSTPVTHNESDQASDAPTVRTIGYRTDEFVEEVPASPADLISPEPETLPFDTATDGLTLESLEQLALQNNPSLQQASASASKAAGIRTQVGLKPNPTLEYFGVEIGNADSAGLHGASLSQTFVRGGKLGWNRQVVGHDVAFARWQFEAQRFRVLNDIRIQFYEALGAQKRLELAREFRVVAEEGVDVSEARVQMKEAARPDILQSEVQLSEVVLAIQQAEFESAAAWNSLVATVGMPGLTPTTLIGDLDTPIADRDLETAYAQLVAESPLLAAARTRVRRARANLQRQLVQPIPNLKAQLGAGYDDGTGDEFANVQLSLPIPLHNRNQGNIRAAYAEYRAATQNVNRLRLQLRRDLAQAMRGFQVAQATVRQYDTSILPKVGETLELMLRAREAGEFDFLRVLTARRAYFGANLKYVVALTDLAQANTKIDGLLLTGGLDQVITYNGTDELRGAALSGQ